MKEIKIIPVAANGKKRQVSFFNWLQLNFALFLALPTDIRNRVTAIILVLTALIGMGCFMVIEATTYTVKDLKAVYAKDLKEGKVAYSVVTTPAREEVEDLPELGPEEFVPIEKEAPVEDNRPSPAPSMPKLGSVEPSAYARKYASLARQLWVKYKIPVSITLAQGIIESRSGTSKLAVQNNNHFGIKCFAKNCRKGHCTNHTDDTHKDFFRKFKTVQECFAERGRFLSKGRYVKLKKYGNDYKKWAHGLKAAGYATDPTYDDTLIRTIQRYGLDKY